MSTNTKLAEALRACMADIELWMETYKRQAGSLEVLDRAREALAAHEDLLRENAEQAQPLKGRPDFIAVYDAAIADELPRVSHVGYDSHDICKHFAGKVRERLLAAQAPVSAANSLAQRQPLTDEQKENLIAAYFPNQRKEVLALIGAVEKFYGIGATTGEQQHG